VRARLAIVCVVLAAAAGAARADARGDAVLARARAVERAQLEALRGTTLQMHTRGTFRDGDTRHAVEAMRHLAVDRGGAIRNDFIWGKLDGRIVGERELRQASGAPKKPRGQAESLTVALAPLTARDIDVRPVGPLDGGGYLLRCTVHRNAAIDALELVVDEASGRKRTATLHPAGVLVRLADRADLALTYAPDGTPAALHSLFAARILWVDRAADLVTRRVR
jgi:hypothetical protein